jgi:hypothetical protein
MVILVATAFLAPDPAGAAGRKFLIGGETPG